MLSLVKRTSAKLEESVWKLDVCRKIGEISEGPDPTTDLHSHTTLHEHDQVCSFSKIMRAHEHKEEILVKNGAFFVSPTLSGQK